MTTNSTAFPLQHGQSVATPLIAPISQENVPYLAEPSGTSIGGDLILANVGMPPAITDALSAGLRRRVSEQLIVFKILHFGSLKPGWDGPDSIQPSPIAVRHAVEFLEGLPVSVRLPRVFVEGDGEIGFFWKFGSAYAEVGFRGPLIGYYARSSQGHEIQGEHQYNGFKESIRELEQVLMQV